MKGVKTPPYLAEKAKALYPLYESYAAVARIIGLPVRTVEQIVKADDEYTEFRGQQKKLMIQEVHKVATDILRQDIKPGTAKSMGEAAITFGVLVDKMATLAGENTKWQNQQVNIGDNRKVVIAITSEAQSLVKRK